MKSPACGTMLDCRRRRVKNCPRMSALHSPAFAARDHCCRIDGIAVLLHLDDFAIFVDQVSHASRGFVAWVVDAVLLADIATHVAEEREGYADLLRPCFVGEWTVHAHTQNLGVC